MLSYAEFLCFGLCNFIQPIVSGHGSIVILFLVRRARHALLFTTAIDDLPPSWMPQRMWCVCVCVCLTCTDFVLTGLSREIPRKTKAATHAAIAIKTYKDRYRSINRTLGKNAHNTNTRITRTYTSSHFVIQTQAKIQLEEYANTLTQHKKNLTQHAMSSPFPYPSKHIHLSVTEQPQNRTDVE